MYIYYLFIVKFNLLDLDYINYKSMISNSFFHKYDYIIGLIANLFK